MRQAEYFRGEDKMNELTKEQEIALRLLAAQNDVIWASSQQQTEAIMNAVDMAKLFIRTTNAHVWKEEG